MSLPDAIPPLSYDEALNGPLPSTGDLLDSLVGVIRRFVVLSPEQLDALALWVLHAYAIEAADTTPYLAITSPEKRSGKSRLLEVLAQLVPRAMEAANISDAALFRALGGDGLPVTLLFDEIDAVFGSKQAQNKEELRGLINAGYRRGAVAWRCVGEGAKQEVCSFPVFGPKALAGIGNLPDTIADRSISIRLRRRLPDERVERGRYKRIRSTAAPVAHSAARWVAANLEALKAAEPEIPAELGDRAADGAEPLLAIADLAGEEWAKRARASVIALHGEGDAEASSWGIQLLGAIQFAFGEADRLSTAQLLELLKEDDEAPWASWGKSGDGLNPRGLAKLLRPYGIHSKSIRVDADSQPRGFKREQFEEAWNRYLAPPTDLSAATSDTTALASQKTALFNPPQDTDVADTEGASNPHSNAVVAVVADTSTNGGPEGPATPEKLSGCTVARLIEGDNQDDEFELATEDEEALAERYAAEFGGQS